MRRVSLVILLLAGCSPNVGVAPDAVTYYRDVRPILAEHCVGCHVNGGIAPIALDTYATAADAASLVALRTAARIMPPFLADNSGQCQTFATHDWLSDDELATLTAWQEQGAPEGDPSTPAPPIAEVPHLTGANIQTIDTGVDYVPNAAQNDDYHCFLVQAPRGGYVTGAEVRPGNARIVHHVIVFEPSSDDAVNEVMGLDAAEAGPGYTCFGDSGTADATPVVLWAPGGGASIAPAGTGLQIDGTRPLIVQVHYNLLSVRPGDTDRSHIDMQIEDSAIPGFFLPVYDGAFVAPPHMTSVSSHYDFPVGAAYLTPYGATTAHIYVVGPHMHTLGRDIQLDMLNDDGSTDCLVHIPRWDFNWQRGYQYETPIPITDTTRVRITCTWDTSSRDSTVTWGESTQDEMCLAYLYVSI